jgi:hypothetical protein
MQEKLRILMAIGTFAVGMYSIACTPWREQYLAERKGRDNQDAVSVKLGPPTAKEILPNGNEVWIYQYTGAAISTQGEGIWCYEYLLRFDAAKVLSDYSRRNC